jgi:hypothetical protein
VYPICRATIASAPVRSVDETVSRSSPSSITRVIAGSIAVTPAIGVATGRVVDADVPLPERRASIPTPSTDGSI